MDIDFFLFRSRRGVAFGPDVESENNPLDAAASRTSDSLMAPTPARSTRTVTLSVESFSSVSRNTSADPLTSAFRMSGSSLISPAAICLCNCSSVRQLSAVAALGDFISWRDVEPMARAPDQRWRRALELAQAADAGACRCGPVAMVSSSCCCAPVPPRCLRARNRRRRTAR